MACIEISAENITAAHLDISAAHICSVNTEGYEQLVTSDGPILTADGEPIYVKLK